MPATFTIDFARRLVLSRAWGVLVDEDLRETQRGVRETPGFARDFRQLYDFSDVTELGVTGDGLWDISRQSPFARDARRAIVVASSEAFGMARMFQLVGEREVAQFRIFYDRESAMRWLDDESDA